MTIRHKGKSQGEATEEGTVVTQYIQTSSESSDQNEIQSYCTINWGEEEFLNRFYLFG